MVDFSTIHNGAPIKTYSDMMKRLNAVESSASPIDKIRQLAT